MAESIWKKEISFGRKAKPDATEAPAVEAAAAVDAAPKQPVWKKEISLGRVTRARSAAPKAPKEPKAAKQKSDSVWKKEIALGRKRKGAEIEPVSEVEAGAVVAPPPAAETLPEPALELPSAEEYNWLTATFDPQAAVPAQPVVEEPVVDLPGIPVALDPVVLQAPAVAAPAPVVAPQPPVAAEPTVPTVSVSLPPAPVAPPPPPAPPVADAVPPPPMSVPVAPPPMPSIAYTPPAAPVVEAPVVEVAQPAAVVADETPEPEAKTPFWKKELSLGKKDKTPKAKREQKPKAEKEKAAKVDKTPFWKKELGGKAKAKAKAKDADFDTPKAAKPKRERKQKTPTSSKKTNAKQTLVGLKIGASQIAAARISNSGGPQLVQLARETLDDGIVIGGELRDLEGLAEVLKQFFAKHKLPKKGVRLGIANNRIGVRTFEITGIDDPKQLANAIRFRAQETLPIPLEEAVLDWQVLAETTDPETGQKTRRVLLVVAYRELVDRYVAACRKAGISLSGIDLEAFAMLRAVAEPLAADAPPATGAQVVVNVGHDRSTFAVSDGRVCEFTRVLGWGGSALSVAIARALDITPSEADPIKHALSLVATDAQPEGIAPETLEGAREAVRRELQAFARELVSSLRFYQNQPGSLGIGELVLTGGTPHLPGFSDELERLIGVPVKVADPLARVRIPKKFKEPERVGSLTVAIGLGIED